jgi:endonuclease/exonuclease/phosphatase family metal-dependent hydrolase
MLRSLVTTMVSRLAVPLFGVVASVLSFASVAVVGARRVVRPALPPSASARRTAGVKRTVRVLDWNLLHARRDNDKRLEIVARTIEAEQPDVVALQEVSESWVLRRPNRAKLLAKRLGFAWQYRGTNGVPRVWEEGLAVLARRTIVRTARRRLAGSQPRPLDARQVLVGEIHLEHQTAFAVASIHLSLPENGEVENLEQALDAADLIAREVLAHGIPAVLVGDLNAPPSALSVRALTTGDILGGDAPFVDAWAAVGSGPGITISPTNPYTDAPGDPPQRIDYVLVLQGTHPQATPVAARLIGDRPAEGGVYGSDHFGLVVDLELDGRPTGGPSDEQAAALAAWNLCARIARARSKIRALRDEARAEIDRTRLALGHDQAGGYLTPNPAQMLRNMTLAKVRAAFAPAAPRRREPLSRVTHRDVVTSTGSAP